MQRLVLMRHATALKNLENRHGGEGTRLDASGHKELHLLVKRFSELQIEPRIVYASPVPQAQQSAAILRTAYNIPLVTSELLTPLHLGVLSGLSEEEARRHHQDAALAMESWRRGEIEVCDLKISGAEKISEFYKRGCTFLSSLSDQKLDVLIVGTRSILVLLISILLLRSPIPGGGYKEIPIECCDFFTFVRRVDTYTFHPQLSHGQLKYLDGNQ